MLLCLNSEWQGCDSPQLEHGACEIARELFGDAPHVDLGPADCDSLDVRDGVFALDCVATRFLSTLGELERAAPESVFTIGGTCAAEAAPVAYLAGRHEGLGAVWFDAHGDLNTPSSSPSGHFHGMVLRTLLGDGPSAVLAHIEVPLDPRRVAVVGARDLDTPEREHAAAAGVGIIEGWPPDVLVRLRELLDAAAVENLYIHVDVDVFDPTRFGDALYPVPGGPSLESVSALVRELVTSYDIVGVGVVESCGRQPSAAPALKEFLVDARLWGRARSAARRGSEASGR